MRTARVMTTIVAGLAALAAGTVPVGASAHEGTGRGHDDRAPVVRELTAFADPDCVSGCGSGSTVGPDGALYVTDGPGGRVLRVDPRSGATTTYVDGLPQAIPEVGIGGAVDVVFRERTAYVLVTMVGPEFGQPEVVAGLYRVGRDGEPTVVADLGRWSVDNPPDTDIFVASGVMYALERYAGGFLVTDGHHNRVLWVSARGDIHELRAFENVVPTGLEVRGRTIDLAQAGPIPHLPEDGTLVRFTPWSPVREVASGAPLLVDVERGRGHRLYALSQGVWDLPNVPENEGMPASPDSGALLRVTRDGELVTVVEGLDRPTSVEIVGDTAFVTTLTGTVVRVDGLRHAR